MAAVLSTPIPGLPEPKRGKVREVFDLGDHLLIVATDRISAFDVVLPNGIPNKGQVLNQISAFWFKRLVELGPNHCISVHDMVISAAVGAQVPELTGRAMLARKANPLPIEAVARGYLDGSFYAQYAAGKREICGVELPDGLERGSRLPQPIFTPATKAESGHDENISFAQAEDIIGKERAAQVRDWTLQLFAAASEYAESRGLILADTKFEFGLIEDELIWIDEALSPDSSRYWEAATWKPGGPQPSFDKQFVRDYLESLEWDKTDPGPELPEEIVMKTRAKYLEVFERLTGHVLAV